MADQHTPHDLLRLEPGDLDHVLLDIHPQSPAQAHADMEPTHGAALPADFSLLWPPGLFDHDFDMYATACA